MSIGSGNGLVLKSQQAIIWTKADLVHWHTVNPSDTEPGYSAIFRFSIDIILSYFT